MATSLLVETNCIYFKGENPAFISGHATTAPIWPFGPKILVIKCRAQGDVLRRPLLTGPKRQYSEAFITWLVDEETVDLLRGIP